jgi:hypothetical protein
MAGDKFTSEQLNEELVNIINMLKTFEIKNWFIGYIIRFIRENKCIDKDDDVDIIIHKDDFSKLELALKKKWLYQDAFFS